MIIYLWCLQREDKKTASLSIQESPDVGGAFGLCCRWWDCVTSSCFNRKSTVWLCCEPPLFSQRALFFTDLHRKLLSQESRRPTAGHRLNAAVGGWTSVWIWPSCSLLPLDQNCFTVLLSFKWSSKTKRWWTFFHFWGVSLPGYRLAFLLENDGKGNFQHSGCSPSARGRVWICAASPALLLQEEAPYIRGCQSRVSDAHLHSCQFKWGRWQQWRLTVFNSSCLTQLCNT